MYFNIMLVVGHDGLQEKNWVMAIVQCKEFRSDQNCLLHHSTYIWYSEPRLTIT